MNKEGSSLLTVIILISLISFFCLQMWRTTVLLFDATLAKQLFQQQSVYLQGVLCRGVDLCSHNYDAIVDYTILNKSGLTLEMSEIKNFSVPCNAIVSWNNILKNNRYALQCVAKLVHKKREIMQIACTIIKEYDQEDDSNRYRISKWRLENKA